MYCTLGRPPKRWKDIMVKIKTNAEEKMSKYKAKLVAKRFTRVKRFNYVPAAKIRANNFWSL